MERSREELAFLRQEKKLREMMKKMFAEMAAIPNEYLSVLEREIVEMRRVALEKSWADLDSGKSMVYDPAAELKQLADTKQEIEKRVAPKIEKAKNCRSCKNYFILFLSITITIFCYIRWALDHPYHPFLQTEPSFWFTLSIAPAGLMTLFFLLAWYNAEISKNK